MSTEIFFDGYSLNLQFYEGLNNIIRNKAKILYNIYIILCITVAQL